MTPTFFGRRLASTLVTTRPLSSSAAARSRLPTLGEITHSPKNTSAFKAKLEAFRESQRPKPKPETPAPAAGGIVKAIIYGSEQGQREEAEMEQSYSKVLARGKYVHAIEIHQVKPDRQAEYLKLVGEVYPAIAAGENGCHLVGSWKTEIGDPDTFSRLHFNVYASKRCIEADDAVHIWEYQGYAGYHSTLHKLSSSPAYEKLLAELPSLIKSRRTDLMQEFSFWPTSPPRSLGGIFELRSYTLHAGKLLEWEEHWSAGLRARRNVMEGVGAWFTQVGALNHVHYLWQFPDLRERQLAREKSWNEKGWGETVHRTVPLIKKMDSRILVPLPWSPVS